ncbi:hypothetical protein [Methanopyrus kandleri]
MSVPKYLPLLIAVVATASPASGYLGVEAFVTGISADHVDVVYMVYADSDDVTKSHRVTLYLPPEATIKGVKSYQLPRREGDVDVVYGRGKWRDGPSYGTDKIEIDGKGTKEQLIPGVDAATATVIGTSNRPPFEDGKLIIPTMTLDLPAYTVVAVEVSVPIRDGHVLFTEFHTEDLYFDIQEVPVWNPLVTVIASVDRDGKVHLYGRGHDPKYIVYDVPVVLLQSVEPKVRVYVPEKRPSPLVPFVPVRIRRGGGSG